MRFVFIDIILLNNFQKILLFQNYHEKVRSFSALLACFRQNGKATPFSRTCDMLKPLDIGEGLSCSIKIIVYLRHVISINYANTSVKNS